MNKWVQTFREEGLDNVDVWFQDEARFGQQNTTTRLWVERGSRPRVVKQQQFEYAYLFGSVCLLEVLARQWSFLRLTRTLWLSI
ncbi:hypothetical protein QRC94_002342 [Vibrio vulnificus]|nr:hypothetical protein [Vibrio vulnificus]EJC6744858.1 hypothetical protein [Vibrio vulnificus]EJC6821197.1 hypothetical protein [Vibrio vulnificus]EJC6953842.1 hypothetical protein [Vibrio vulnificus]EJC6959386.1 hypothetical protein [Vibrio vulnificus]